MEGNDTFIKIDEIGKYFDLTKSFYTKWAFGSRILKAVDHVSFQIKKGETLGLVGELSDETVRRRLKETSCSPGADRVGVCPR